MKIPAMFLGLILGLAADGRGASGDGRDGQEIFRRFALAIGSNLGGQERDTLLYADSDAETFGTLLGEMGGVVSADARVLKGPTPEQLDAAFLVLRKQVAAIRKGLGRTEVIIYYSGHADERGLLLGGRSFSYDRFRGKIDSIPADVRIAVLDACASGAITRLKGGRRRPAFAVDASSDMRGYAFLTSSSPDEASQESDQIKSSFFTHYLVSGMRGAADVSGDGKVTLGEAYQFAFHETLARTERTKGGPQHPAYDMKLSGTGDVVMTDMRQTSAGLVLAKDLEGRFFVRNRDNLLVAELYKPMGRAVELGLAPGTYSIRLEQKKALSTSSLELAEGRRSEITAGDFAPIHLESTTSRGGAAGSGRTVTMAEAALDTEAAGATAAAPAVPAASDPTVANGVGFEIRDQFDIATDSKHVLSLGLLLNRQRQPFHGLQLTLFFNHASRSLHGGQISALGNITQGPLTGFQLSPIGGILLDTLSGIQGAGLFNFALEGGRGGQASGIINVSGGLQGGQGAGIANFGLGHTRGGQGAGIANITKGIEGGQGAGIANFNLGRTQGGQGAGIMNVAIGLKGGQGAGIMNVNAGHGQGGQGAGVMNISGGMKGGQGAGVLNLNYGHLQGGQGAGVLNVSRGVQGGQVAGVLNISLGDASGTQVAGVMNAARDVKGVQATGVFNAARDVDGFQFGLVNISRDIRNGFPIGLINYSHTGLHSLNLWTDEMGYQNSTVLSGTRHVFTFVSIGKKFSADRNRVTLGLGAGAQRPFGAWYGSVDAGAFQLLDDWEFDTDGNNDSPELFRVRLQAGREVLPLISFFGGASFNYLWNHSGREGNYPWGDYQIEAFKDQHVWPGLFAGIRLGR